MRKKRAQQWETAEFHPAFFKINEKESLNGIARVDTAKLFPYNNTLAGEEFSYFSDHPPPV